MLIQSQEGKPLQEIVAQEGYLALRRIEEQVITGHGCTNGVVATGGSAVYRPPAMAHLLGGSKVHMEKSGVAHFAGENDEETIHLIKELLSFFPQNNPEKPPIIPCIDDPNRMEESLKKVGPEDSKKAYDMKKIILGVVDYGYFLEVQKDWAKNIVVGFARFNGNACGNYC